MSNELMSNTLLGIVLQSDTMTKMVLGSLFVLSIICWTVAIYSIMALRAKLKEMHSMHELLKEAKTIAGIKVLVEAYPQSLLGVVMSQWLKSIHAVEKLYQKKAMNITEAVSAVQDEVANVTDELVATQKKYMPIISVGVASSPLLGLLGTVWGLVDSFLRMSEKQSADIVTVAPGIAEALITTVAGLLVAIPALFTFYVCQYHITQIEEQLLGLEYHLSSIARLHLVDLKHSAHADTHHMGA